MAAAGFRRPASIAQQKEGPLGVFQVSSDRGKGGSMAKAMTKSQVLSHLAEKADVSKKTAQLLMEGLAALAYKEAQNGFTIPGIGKLVLVSRKARM